MAVCCETNNETYSATTPTKASPENFSQIDQ